MVKRMWVAPRIRGLGLGRRLLSELEVRADAGVAADAAGDPRRTVQGIRMYTTSGYREVDPFNDEPYAHHWFEKSLS